MIEDATLFKSYLCDGSVETFNITVDYLKSATNIKIYYVVIATGVQYLLVKNTNYTVDIINDTITTTTGSITGLGSTATPYASGIKLNILLDVPYTQLVDIVSNSDYNPESLEGAYDKNTLLAKQVQEILNRTVQLQEGDAGTTLVLPPLVDLANKVLAFDSTGQPTTLEAYVPTPTEGYIEVTGDTTMVAGKKYLSIGNNKLTPPSSPVVGTILEIMASGYPVITQPDAENAMNFKEKYFTTKGITGYIQMFAGELLKLIYKGMGLSRIEPGLKITNPATLPANTGNGVAFSYDGTYMAVAHTTTPYVTIYKRAGDVFTKLADPATLPLAHAKGIAFSFDGTYLAVAYESTQPYLTIYKRAGDVFTKLEDIDTTPTGPANGVAFSYDGTYMTVAHGNIPYLTIYKRAGDVFTKLTNPATLPIGIARGVAFSYDGTYMAVAHSGYPYVTIYKRAGDVFTKLTNPATLPTGEGFGVSFSYDGTYMAVAHTTTPYVTIYKRAGDVFTKLADPATLPTGDGQAVSFSYDGTYMAVAHQTTPFITIYKRAGDTFTKLADPADLTIALAHGVAFSYDGTYMADAHSGTPYVTIYKNKESATKSWIVSEFEVMNPADPSDGDGGDLEHRFK